MARAVYGRAFASGAAQDVPALHCGSDRPGDRKSVQPMAARAVDVGYDQLHHFVAAGAWDSAPLDAALLKKADRLVGDRAAQGRTGRPFG